MTVAIQKGALDEVKQGSHEGDLIVAVCGLLNTKLGTNNRLTGKVADGSSSMAAGFAAKAVGMFESKQLNSNDIIRITNKQLSKTGTETKMMVLDFEVVGKHTGEDLLACESQPPAKKPANATTMKAGGGPLAPISPSETPNTPVPPTAPAREFSFPTPGSALNTPAAPSPVAFTAAAKENAGARPAGTLPVASEVKHQAIHTLNPYRVKWTIRAKVDRKQEKKVVTLKSEQTSILTVVLVDEEGKQIEGTFWRDMADKMDSELVEGRVYYFSNGNVSPSNRKYSTVDNDYKINFSDKSDVQLAENQDADKMKARCSFTKIDCLAAKLSRKVPVDVVAIVHSVAPLGSVKRQSDGTEFNRRDVTLVDDTRKTVTLTLWREQAETEGTALETQLAAGEHPVVVVTKARLSDFNGVSLSGSYSSRIEVSPSGYKEADALAEWWQSEGNGQTFAPAGDAAPRSGGGGRSKWMPLETLPETAAAESDPPVFASLNCIFTKVPPEQNLYYEANPATNKKVEDDGSGTYKEVGSGIVADSMARRYILNAAVSDFTGERLVNVFNEQAASMLQASADELHAKKTEDVNSFQSALQATTWSEWVLDVMAKPREYKGTVSMRVNVRNARPVNWAADAATLVKRLSGAA